MRTKNAAAITAAEREHLRRLKESDCCVCGAPGPCDAHHINQGQHYTALPLCKVCHTSPVYGIHGQRFNWKAVKLDELGALNLVIGRLMKDA